MTWLLCTFGIPTLLQGYIIGAGSMMVRRTQGPFFRGPVLFAAKRGKADYSTTLGAFVALSPGASPATFHHETIHVRQYLGLNVLGGLLAAALAYPLGWWAFAIWGSSGFAWLAPDYLIATLRFKRRGVSWKTIYYKTEFEQDAYARTKTDLDGETDRWEI